MVTTPPAPRLIGISSMATRHLLNELAATYAQRAGCVTAFEAIGGVDAERRVQQGETFDVVVLAAPAIERLAAGGHVEAASRVDLVRSAMAIAIPAGAPRPRLDDDDAVRAAVLAARTIGISTGPSGTHVARLLERWGIAGAVAPRLVHAPPGVPVGTLVARGDAALGFQQLSELVGLPGIDVIDTLPRGVQSVTVFAAAIGRDSTHGEVAAAFLRWLASADTVEAKRRHGMAPA